MPTVLSLKKTNNKATKRKNKELSTTKGMKTKETTKKKKRFKKRKALFVVKLFQFLMSNDQHVDIVSWYKDCFVVWDRDLFETNVLPLLFSHNKYASFERQINFYNFAKMSIHEEFPTKQRIGKKEPIKYKHRMFYKGASLQQIQSIERSTSPHQIQELQETIESVNEQIALIIENKRIIREKIATAQKVLNQYLSNDTVVEAAVQVAPEETNTFSATEPTPIGTHDLSSNIPFEFEMLEPNEEDIAMFFGAPVDGMASNTGMINLPVLDSTFDYTTGI
jgi:hypothetical protein